MRLVAIPPYQNPAVSWGWVLQKVLADYKKTGALQGIEVDADEGYLFDDPSELRDEEFAATITLGIIKKVKQYSESGKYDAIVLTGALDPGFRPARMVSRVPVTSCIHAALHVASLIGERCSVVQTVAPSNLIVRHIGDSSGFGHKLASVRFTGHSSTKTYKILTKYRDKWPERLKDPGLLEIINDTADQAIAAIEEERADSIILGCEHLHAIADGIRQRLDEKGYREIPIVRGFPAAIELAQAMVNMKLLQAARAYPGPGLKAEPRYW